MSLFPDEDILTKEIESWRGFVDSLKSEEHAMKDHGYKPEDLMTPELREKIRSHIKRS